ADVISLGEAMSWPVGDAAIADDAARDPLAGDGLSTELRALEIEVALRLSPPPYSEPRRAPRRRPPLERIVSAVSDADAVEAPWVALAQLFAAGVSIDWDA